jgi:hypothetical protein
MVRGLVYATVLTSCLAVLTLESFTPRARVAMAPVPAAATAAVLRLDRPAPREAVAVLLARPLFSRDRRPAIAAPQAVTPLPRLSGIMVTGTRRYAIFAPDRGAAIIAAEGSSVGGFRISEITARLVIAVGPNGAMTLRTRYEAAGDSAGAAIVTGPVPVVLPGGITLYPATKQNLPDAASWPGPAS